ncbi:MAG: hypothetical protein KY476_00260 [Planctomycetes bacterium]|nr:hypothetical protein [Planctomycetota bacterium]
MARLTLGAAAMFLEATTAAFSLSRGEATLLTWTLAGSVLGALPSVLKWSNAFFGASGSAEPV